MRTTLLTLALLATGCAESDRDYTLEGECPMRANPSEPAVCDRGVGYTPRFVTIEDCVNEAGLTYSNNYSLSLNTHPARERCLNEILLLSYADIRDGYLAKS